MLQTTQRQDVVLKTILRLIRRFYVQKFNKVTNYIKSKKGKAPSYYREQLHQFVIHLSKSKNGSVKAALNDENSPLAHELVTLFGAFFYPKDMKESEVCFDEASSTHGVLRASTLFDLIHKALYNFSNNNLHALFSQSAAFRLLVKISLSKKREIFFIPNEEEEVDPREEEKVPLGSHLDQDFKEQTSN